MIHGDVIQTWNATPATPSISRLPVALAANSPAPAKSTMPVSSAPWTRPGSGGWVGANTPPRPRPASGCAGCARLTARAPAPTGGRRFVTVAGPAQAKGRGRLTFPKDPPPPACGHVRPRLRRWRSRAASARRPAGPMPHSRNAPPDRWSVRGTGSNIRQIRNSSAPRISRMTCAGQLKVAVGLPRPTGDRNGIGIDRGP